VYEQKPRSTAVPSYHYCTRAAAKEYAYVTAEGATYRTLRDVCPPCVTPEGRPQVWRFPGDQNTQFFRVSSFTWPAAWSAELWVKALNPGGSGTYFFSFGKDGPNGGATGGKDNCILLRESGLTLNTWQHLVLTWDGTTMTTYLDGGSAPSICHDPACHDAGGIDGCLQTAAATGSLVVGNDQDAHTGEWVVNQPDQAANVMIDTFAIYSTAWSAAEVASRTSYCAERNGLDLYALWSGPSGEDLSGHGWTAEVTSAAAGDTCPHVDGEAGACVATAVDACA